MKIFEVYNLLDVNIQSSLGSYVKDETGRKYLDFYGGHAVISIGHSHPHFVQRIKDQMDKTLFYSNSVKNDLQEELAEKIGKLSGYPDYSLFMVNSGAEAMENALKLASFHNGKTKVLSFEKGFHGRTSAAVHITDNKKISAPINRGFEHKLLPWNDVKALEEALRPGDSCAVVIEGVQGIGGVHIPDPEFMHELRYLCDKYEAVLILDEIQSGYGRTGKFFAHQHAGVRADLITVAKGMGNGFPIGGVLISPEFEAKPGLLGSTFGGTHLACTAGLGVLEVLEAEDLIQNAAILGKQMEKALQHFSEVEEVRAAGCMIGIDLPFPIKDFRQKLIKDFGVFTGTSSQPNTLRVLPPLSVSEGEIQEFITAFGNCLSEFNHSFDKQKTNEKFSVA